MSGGLRRIRNIRLPVAAVLLLAALFFLRGCTGLSSGDSGHFGAPGWQASLEQREHWPRRDVRQSHALHKEEGLACTDCHPGAESEARAGMPYMDDCAACHEEEADMDAEDYGVCLKCHTYDALPEGCTEDACSPDDLPEVTVAMGPPPVPNLRYRTEEDAAGFSHALHAEAEVRCADCHGPIAEEGRIPFPAGRYMPSARVCFACHAKGLAGFSHKRHIAREIECADCHGDIAQDASRPLERGRYLPDVQSVCRDCHEPVEGDCSTCHTPGTYSPGDAPSSHTPRVSIPAADVSARDTATAGLLLAGARWAEGQAPRHLTADEGRRP